MRRLVIRDETLTSGVVHEFELEFQAEYITVAELIKRRIISEVEKYQQSVSEYSSHYLVTSTAMEKRLNDLENKTVKRAKIDIDKQIELAFEAFENNGFFILFDDSQVENLHQKLLVTNRSQVTFIKLTPLVGG